MSTLTLDVPPSALAKWNALPEDERDRRAQAIIEAMEAPVSLSKGVSLEQFTERRRAYWKEKGFDFDKDVAEARPVMEG